MVSMTEWSAVSTDRHRAPVLGRDVGAGAVGRERRRARPGPDVEHRGHLVRLGVDDRDLVVVLRRDVDPPAVGAAGHALGLAPDRELGEDLAALDVDDARERRVLVGHEDPGAVQAHRHLLGVGARVQHVHYLSRRDVHDADAVGRAVGRGQRRLVDPRRGRRRAAEGDEEALTGRIDLDAARALPEGDGRHDLVGSAGDDRQVARRLVGDERAVGRRGGGFLRRRVGGRFGSAAGLQEQQGDGERESVGESHDRLLTKGVDTILPPCAKRGKPRRRGCARAWSAVWQPSRSYDADGEDSSVSRPRRGGGGAPAVTASLATSMTMRL